MKTETIDTLAAIRPIADAVDYTNVGKLMYAGMVRLGYGPQLAKGFIGTREAGCLRQALREIIMNRLAQASMKANPDKAVHLIPIDSDQMDKLLDEHQVKTIKAILAEAARVEASQGKATT